MHTLFCQFNFSPLIPDCIYRRIGFLLFFILNTKCVMRVHPSDIEFFSICDFCSSNTTNWNQKVIFLFLFYFNLWIKCIFRIFGDWRRGDICSTFGLLNSKLCVGIRVNHYFAPGKITEFVNSCSE